MESENEDCVIMRLLRNGEVDMALVSLRYIEVEFLVEVHE